LAFIPSPFFYVLFNKALCDTKPIVKDPATGTIHAIHS